MKTKMKTKEVKSSTTPVKPTKAFWADLHELALLMRRIRRNHAWSFGNKKVPLLLLPSTEESVSNSLYLLQRSISHSKEDQPAVKKKMTLAEEIKEAIALEAKVKHAMKQNKAFEMRFASTPINPKLYGKAWTDEKDQHLATPQEAASLEEEVRALRSSKKVKASWCEESPELPVPTPEQERQILKAIAASPAVKRLKAVLKNKRKK